MSKFRVLGGDFKAGSGRFTMRSFSLPSFNLKAYFETVSLRNIYHISRAPLDMVEMVIDDKEQLDYIHNHPTQTTFLVTLKDKRRFVGITDKDTFFKVVEAHRAQKDSHQSRGAAVPSS